MTSRVERVKDMEIGKIRPFLPPSGPLAGRCRVPWYRKWVDRRADVGVPCPMGSEARRWVGTSGLVWYGLVGTRPGLTAFAPRTNLLQFDKVVLNWGCKGPIHRLLPLHRPARIVIVHPALPVDKLGT